MAELRPGDDVREAVRERYAAAARAAADGGGGCAGSEVALTDPAGAGNVEFLKGFIEQVPLPDASVDVIISNCVINLAGDKAPVFAEAARVLKPGGRFAVSDVVADGGLDDATRADMAAWTGCIAGALTRAELEDGLRAAGFGEIEIRETHRVHAHAASAIIRARRA